MIVTKSLRANPINRIKYSSTAYSKDKKCWRLLWSIAYSVYNVYNISIVFEFGRITLETENVVIKRILFLFFLYILLRFKNYNHNMISQYLITIRVLWVVILLTIRYPCDVWVFRIKAMVLSSIFASHTSYCLVWYIFLRSTRIIKMFVMNSTPRTILLLAVNVFNIHVDDNIFI